MSGLAHKYGHVRPRPRSPGQRSGRDLPL